MWPHAACGSGWGSLSNWRVQVTGQFGSYKLYSSVSPYQFEVIFELLFTLCLLFILNLDGEEKCCLLGSRRPQLNHSNTYIFTELNWKTLEKLCTEQGRSISNKILLFNFPFLCFMQIKSFCVLELSKGKQENSLTSSYKSWLVSDLEHIFCNNPYKQAMRHSYVLPWTNIQCRTYFEKLTLSIGDPKQNLVLFYILHIKKSLMLGDVITFRYQVGITKFF